MAKILVQSGCSQALVGKVVDSILHLAGLSVKGQISHQTVQCAILEGGIAADIQLGHKMNYAQCKSTKFLH